MKPAQNSLNGHLRRVAPPELVTTLRSVGQDKRGKQTAREATPQASRKTKTLRAQRESIKSARTQKGNEQKRHTVQLTIWVHPGVKVELERIAKEEGLTLSKTAAAALEGWLAQSLHIQHAGILQPIIEQTIRKSMRAYSNRLAVLLVRSIFATEQTRSIATNILGRQQGVTQKALDEILDGSQQSAKRNITRVTPQLETLIEETEQWLVKGEEAPHEN